MRSLSIEWFTGLPKERHVEMTALIRNSTILLRQLNTILDKWEEELNTQECKISDYDTPAWDVKQAHRNGDRSRIRKFRDLLNFLPETMK